MPDEGSAPTPSITAPVADNAQAGKSYTQADMDNIMEKVRETTAKKLSAEFEERINRERMSEAEKIKADYEAEKARSSELESKLSRVERAASVSRAATGIGYVPDEYLDRAIGSAGDDAKPEDIAKAAYEKFTADAAKLKPSGTPQASTPRTGPISDGSLGLENLDDAGLNRLAMTKGAKFYTEHIKPEWDRRRLRAAGK